MKIEIAQHAHMSERGSSLLRLIQNNEMPVLDLLVREAVQNSLDASSKKAGFINVEFNVKEFDSNLLNAHFEGITNTLNEKFPKGVYKLLEIKDSNTVGLTGPLHYKEVKNNDFGNLLKLIYEISMPQQKEGAGGSWGLGKTVYFRFGIGLVLYYSRIRDEDGIYKSRLAACLVEDENKPDSLLKPENENPQRGIAWWGQEADSNSTKPITNEEEITSILSSFNINPYQGEETGTTIIIPYIDESKLLEETLTLEDKRKINNPVWWTKNIQDYIRVSLQRWYAPRLMNDKYKYGDWLRASVNGKGITREEMLPFFRVIQELYNNEEENSYSEVFEGAEVHKKTITLRKVFKSSAKAGKIAYIKLKREHLKMNAPDNYPSPFVQISNSEGELDFNFPIVAYTRRPGMIVGYETTGYWTDGIPKTGPNEFIVAVFSAESENLLNADHPQDEITLEEYIRKGEKADHTSWNDWNFGGHRKSIIAKIQQQSRNSIADSYIKKTEELVGTRSIGLARTLAELLLPPEGFGEKTGMVPRNSSKPSLSSLRGKNSSLELKQPEYMNDKMKMGFVLTLGKKISKSCIRLQVATESKNIKVEEWESDEFFGEHFPFELLECSIHSIQVRGEKTLNLNTPYRIEKDQKEIKSSEINIKRYHSDRYHICYGIEFETVKYAGCTIEGSFSLRKDNNNVKAKIDVITIEGEQD